MQIISRHMDRVVRDVIRCITLNRKDSNVQVTSISMTRDVVSSLLGHVREVKIIVKHILIGMMVRIVWEDIVLREVIEVKISGSSVLSVILQQTWCGYMNEERDTFLYL